MQKKRITISIVLIILMIYLLTQTKTMQNNQQKTAQALYTTIGTKTYEIDYAVTTEPNAPVLSAGMIPVKYDEEKEEWIITENDENWYDYTSNKPAYMMLNDGVYQSELLPNMTGKKLAKDYVGNDALVVPLDGTIYMWIPRFAYNELGDILYIKQGASVAGSYIVPEIFEYKIENEERPDYSLAGVWIEYKPLASSEEVNTKISNMQGENNQYGLIANTVGVNVEIVQSYKDTINVFLTRFIGGIDSPDNTKRTILQVINTNRIEPIKAKEYYDETEGKIKIEVTYNQNEIVEILDIEGNTLSINSKIAYVAQEDLPKVVLKKQEEIYTNVIIVRDNKGNTKQVDLKVIDVKNYTIPDLDTLKLFRDEVNRGITFKNKQVEVVADIDMNPGKYTIDTITGKVTSFTDDANNWTPIGNANDKNFSGIFQRKWI